jgi:ATP-dependent RNA helicase DeaD
LTKEELVDKILANYLANTKATKIPSDVSKKKKNK